MRLFKYLKKGRYLNMLMAYHLSENQFCCHRNGNLQFFNTRLNKKNLSLLSLKSCVGIIEKYADSNSEYRERFSRKPYLNIC